MAADSCESSERAPVNTWVIDSACEEPCELMVVSSLSSVSLRLHRVRQWLSAVVPSAMHRIMNSESMMLFPLQNKLESMVRGTVVLVRPALVLQPLESF